MTNSGGSATAPQAPAPRPDPSTPVVVDVFAASSPGGGVDFTHEWRWGSDGPSQGNGTIVIPRRKSHEPETEIQFHLRDNTDPKRFLQFKDHHGSAIWVRRDQCPAGDTRCDDSEIPPAEIESAPKLLKVVNRNSEECVLHYRLWFKDKEGKTESYDPDITNGGKI